MSAKEEEETLSILKQEGLFIYRGFLLDMGEMVGEGAFGKVRTATLHLPLATTVAVKSPNTEKCCKSRKEAWSLLREGFRMKDLDHDNVLRVIGVSIKSNGFPMVIMPYMTNGDLHSYIRCDKHNLTVLRLLEFGCEIGDGMAYLNSHQVIHRDLAARNCLLDERLVVKISDFGMARSVHSSAYYISQQTSTPLPLRWMALESLAINKYSLHTDVWSFGVVLWELLTRGETPYHHLDMWNSALLRYLQKGHRLPHPQYCPREIYVLMLKCWRIHPRLRPTFGQLVDDITTLIDQWKNLHPTPPPKLLEPPADGAQRLV